MGGCGGLGLIIMSNLNLSRIKLMLGWVVTIYIFVHYFKIADHNKDQMGFVVLFIHIL